MIALLPLATIPGLKELLVAFVVMILIIAFIAGLIWCIERWISPIPSPVKLIIALILVALILLWAINRFA